MTLAPTPGQTIGPFFGYALPYDGDSELVPARHPDAIRLHGLVLDGAGQPVPGRPARAVAGRRRRRGLPRGRLAAPRRVHVHRLGARVHGRRRVATSSRRWRRVRPCREPRRSSPSPSSPAACSTGCSPAPTCPTTRRALKADSLLSSLDPERRGTLVARPDESGYVFDIRLQGEGETVFLTYPRHAD